MQRTEEENFRIDDLGLRKSGRKLRILALHGKNGNNLITQSQLENLHITEDHYNIVFLNGSMIEDEGVSNHTKNTSGRLYSWFCDECAESRFRASLFQAVRDVLKAISEMGPFDAIYGFAQGATIATIVARASTDTELLSTIIQGLK